MAIQTATMKNTLSDAYKAAAINGAAYTTAPGASAGTEPTGGSPAYARKVISWGSSASGVVTASAIPFDIPRRTPSSASASTGTRWPPAPTSTARR
jgi:hypothetical protein